VWECECDWPAGEVNEGEGGVGGVEPVGAADDQLYLVVECLCAGVAEFQAPGGEDALAVFADRASKAHERLQAAAGEAAEEPVDQLRDGVLAEACGEDSRSRRPGRPAGRRARAYR